MDRRRLKRNRLAESISCGYFRLSGSVTDARFMRSWIRWVFQGNFMIDNRSVVSAIPARHGRSKLIATFGALVFVGFALYSSRASLPGEFVSADLADDPAATPTARAVTAAEAFLSH